MAKKEKKSGSKLTVVLAVTCVCTLLTCGGVVYFFGQTTAQAAPKQLSAAELKALQFDVPKMTTNTSDGGIVQMSLTIQAGDSKTVSELKDEQKQVSDAMESVVHLEPAGAFSSAKGLDDFKKNALIKVRQLLPNDKMDAIYVSDIIAQ